MQRLYRAAQLPSRFLLGGDEFFKVLSQNGELFTAAHRQMKAAQAMGMSPQQVQDEGMMVMLSPRMMREQLELKSSYDTLMSDLGAIGVGMSAFQNTLFGRYVLPFATAPTNDILRTLERIPINPVLVARMLSKDPKARQKAVGQFTCWNYLRPYFALCDERSNNRRQANRQKSQGNAAERVAAL